jgi:hypothetical protein
MELQTILTILGIIQASATLVLIPIIKFILDIRVFIEKEKIVKEMILKEIEDLKQRIKELEEE